MARQSARDSIDALADCWADYQRECDHETCDMAAWECEDQRREPVDNFFLEITRDGDAVCFVITVGGPAVRIRYTGGRPTVQYANWYTSWHDLEITAADQDVLCDVWAYYEDVI